MTPNPLTIAVVSTMTPEQRQSLLDEHGPAIRLLDCTQQRSLLTEQGQSVSVVYGNVRKTDIDHLPHLQWVHATWAGVENLLHEGLKTKAPIVTNTRGQVAEPMSEHCLTALFYLARDFAAYHRAKSDRQWNADAQPRLVRGSTALILGAGSIARTLVPKLKAHWMTVYAVNFDGRKLPGYDGSFTLQSVSSILPEIQWVFVLLPSTPHTRKCLNRDFFSRLKPGAGIINVSRGAVIDEADLRHALDSDQLCGAVLDVTDPEPPARDAWYWDHPKVLLTGHQSCNPPSNALDVAFGIFQRNLRLFLNEQPQTMENRVDLQKGY